VDARGQEVLISAGFGVEAVAALLSLDMLGHHGAFEAGVVGQLARGEFHRALEDVHADLLVAERHLGLIPAPESAESKSLVERIGHKLESCFDLDKILAIAREFSPPYPAPLPPEAMEMKKTSLPNGVRGSQAGIAKIGVIRDRVFNFYYPENFEALGYSEDVLLSDQEDESIFGKSFFQELFLSSGIRLKLG
jgi:hypothetical protein